MTGTIGRPNSGGSEEPFTYTTEDGKEITVASLARPFGTAGELRKLRGASPIELAYYIIERDCDAEALAIVDAMSMVEFNDKFSRQWAQHSGIDLGE
jgi:hypothetical protein